MDSTDPNECDIRQIQFWERKVLNMCGDDGKKVTPVPMPNTEVKLLSADGSEGFPFVRVGRCHADSIIPQ